MNQHASEFGPACDVRQPWRGAGRRGLPLVMLLLTGAMLPWGPARGEEPAAPAPSNRQNEPDLPSDAAKDPVGQGVEVADGVETRMVEAFGQLADTDADVREAARTQLMGLERRYLPAFQKLVERSRPLLPSQAAVLRQIVTHVYLAGEPYAANGNMGFLGVRMLDADVAMAPRANPNGDDAEGDDNPPGDDAPLTVALTGVVITERMPGFVGNRMLLDGDVIVGLADKPGLQFHTGDDFSAAVRQVGAGRTVRFHLLRRGRLVKVAVTLDPRPEAASLEPQGGNGPMTDLLSRRRQKADAYWSDTFAPMLKERLG